KVLTNFDLEKMVDTSDEWITQRTGIKERRIADDGIATSDLATQAGQRALENAGVEPGELDMIVVATFSPDELLPACACHVQHRLGAENAGAYDLSAACAGFVYAFSTAADFVRVRENAKVLVIGAECLSKVTDFTDRTSCIIFGDGAGAVVLGESGDSSDVLYCSVGCKGGQAGMMTIPAGGTRMPASHKTVDDRMHFMRIRGREVFKFAVRKMSDLLIEGMEKCSLTVDDIALVVPHQVNLRIIEPAAERAGIPIEKVFMNIEKYGNTSGASVPLALDEAVKAGRIKRGDHVILVGFGGGLVWGVSVVRW
ncbi:MAG: ketoacyl-ACP synthase III, partial [Planctomycetes bacterium]|nr:ketoacyl-ACP synthase III [Planctomycetota bacterium]